MKSRNHIRTACRRGSAQAKRPQRGGGERGLTLIELMVSLVLGLILIGGVLNIFVSNRQTYRVTENLTRMQENARAGFDFMARDLREAGQSPCGARLVANVIRSSGAIPWWADWNRGTIIGFDGLQDRVDMVAFGTATGERVSGTDAVMVIRAEQDEKVIASHDAVAFQLTLNSVTGLSADDVVVACDLKNSAIFQIGTMPVTPNTISYDPATATLNCSGQLGYPTPAICSTPPTKILAAGGLVSRLTTTFWYIGFSENGKRALYRTTIVKKTVLGVQTVTTEPEEMVPGVQDLQIEYLTTAAGTLATDWVAASNNTTFPGASSTATGNWQTDDIAIQPNHVVAARLTMTLQSDENIGTDQLPLQRSLIHVVGLRSREN